MNEVTAAHKYQLRYVIRSCSTEKVIFVAVGKERFFFFFYIFHLSIYCVETTLRKCRISGHLTAERKTANVKVPPVTPALKCHSGNVKGNVFHRVKFEFCLYKSLKTTFTFKNENHVFWSF